MRRIRRTLRGPVIGVVAVAMLTILGGFASAAIPDANKVFTACVLNKIGTIRLIDKSLPPSNVMSHCTTLETQISWNQLGQPGVQGAPGLAGPAGPAGPPGPAGPAGNNGVDGRNGLDGKNGTDGSNGSNGTDGTDGVSVESAVELPGARCPNGGTKFTAAHGDETYACNGQDGADGSGGASLDALDGSSCRNGAGTTEVTYGSNGSVTLQCNVPIPLTVTTNSIDGGNGTVTSSPAGISCPPTCTAGFQDGTQVTLTATPSGSDAFSAWGNDCGGTSRLAACVLTLSASKHVTAEFAPGSTLILNMSRNATCAIDPHSGTYYCAPEATVASNPAGMSCGPFGYFIFQPINGVVCSRTFVVGTTVTLNSSPAPTSWSEACAGTTGSSCTIELDSTTVHVGVSY